MSMKHERGNILFLILLAVILFAALSYAVTQSLRGGGNDATSEKNELLAAQIVQWATGIQVAINRMELTQVDQVYFDSTTAPNSAGTVYLAGSNTQTGKVVGLFHSSGGMSSLPALPEDAFADYSTAGAVYSIRRLLDMSGNQRGTTTGDKFLLASVLKEDVCRAINKNLTGSTTIPVASVGAIAGYTYWAAKADGTFTGEFNPDAGGSNSVQVPFEYGCLDWNGAGSYRYLHMVEVQ